MAVINKGREKKKMFRIKRWGLFHKKEVTNAIFVDGYNVDQTKDCHVIISKDGKKVFHCQCNTTTDEQGLLDILNFYKNHVMQTDLLAKKSIKGEHIQWH